MKFLVLPVITTCRKIYSWTNTQADKATIILQQRPVSYLPARLPEITHTHALKQMAQESSAFMQVIAANKSGDRLLFIGYVSTAYLQIRTH